MQVNLSQSYTLVLSLKYIRENQSLSRVLSFEIIRKCMFHKSILQSIFWSSFECKNVHEQVHFFNKEILNNLHTHIPNETDICNNKNPPWFINIIEKYQLRNIFEKFITNRKFQNNHEWLQIINGVIKNLWFDTQKFR